MATYYEYKHSAGYGRDDHMADEIIARAARQLGMDVGGRIAQAVGLASHPVPAGGCSVRLPAAPGVRRRMEAALRAARSEVWRPSCRIEVVAMRSRLVRRGAEYSADTWVTEERHGRKWAIVYTHSAVVAAPRLARRQATGHPERAPWRW